MSRSDGSHRYMSEQMIHDLRRKEAPEIVYHYTSMDVLQKIVDTRCLWATAISYLNDAKEREFLLEAVKERLPELQKQEDVSDLIDETYFYPWGIDDETLSITAFAEEAFVASFAVQSDSLMHWRSYCPKQSGVALGFRAKCVAEARLNEALKPGMVVPYTTLSKIEYLGVDSSEELDNLIWSCLSAVASANTQEIDESYTPAQKFWWLLGANACISKHQSFKVEDEYRLLLANIAYREHCLKFRAVQSTLVPYVEMHIPSCHGEETRYDWHPKGSRPWNALAEVVVGPSANIELTKRALEAFFAVRGMVVDVKCSSIPYRDW